MLSVVFGFGVTVRVGVIVVFTVECCVVCVVKVVEGTGEIETPPYSVEQSLRVEVVTEAEAMGGRRREARILVSVERTMIGDTGRTKKRRQEGAVEEQWRRWTSSAVDTWVPQLVAPSPCNPAQIQRLLWPSVSGSGSVSPSPCSSPHNGRSCSCASVTRAIKLSQGRSRLYASWRLAVWGNTNLV